jgi:internalin A
MKKSLIISILTVSIIVLSGCQKTSNTTTTTMPEYISGNYDAKMHTLTLREKWLTTMPDICKDIKDQKTLDDIRSIDLWNNQISSINADYSCLSNLQELNLSYNQISSIKNLEKLKFLSKLELQKNRLTSTKWLEKLSTLKELNLWYNEISDLMWLSNLSNLQQLELQHNQISDISRISKLVNLETLKLEYNQISDVNQLGFVVKLKNLKRLSIGENKLPEDKVVMLQNQINGER